jgi:acetyl-CoA carboxylase biotin carboxyl carrier protein
VTDEGPRGAPGNVAVDLAVDLDALTDEILPALVARLRASRLAELEVRDDGWRVRLRRDLRTARRPSRSHAGDARGPESDDPAASQTRSPAVGYFSPAPGLVVGHAVSTGDTLGSVDVLGIPQEVIAPIGGIVSAVLAEIGQAVEYGQVLVEIDPLGSEAGNDDDVAAVDGASEEPVPGAAAASTPEAAR